MRGPHTCTYVLPCKRRSNKGLFCERNGNNCRGRFGAEEIAALRESVGGKTAAGEELPSGYRDVNVTIEFEGFVVEAQLLVKPLYELKNLAHPTYEICRSLGLVGNVVQNAVETDAVRRPVHTRVLALTLRTFGAAHASFMAMAFVVWGYYYKSVARDLLEFLGRRALAHVGEDGRIAHGLEQRG